MREFLPISRCLRKQRIGWLSLRSEVALPARTNDLLMVLRESDEAEPFINFSLIPFSEVIVVELLGAQRRGASHGGLKAEPVMYLVMFSS